MEGSAAGILISSPPAGVQFVDNRNGSRSLKWTPNADDVGSYDITITAFDLQDTNLRTSQAIELNVTDDTLLVAAPFSASIAQAAYNVQEGNAAGVYIPVTLNRDAGFDAPVTLTISADNPADEHGMTTTLSVETLQGSDIQSTLNLSLAVDVFPILPQQRRFSINASDGTNTATASVDGARQSGPGGLHEINLRIRRANVQSNGSILFPSTAAYIDTKTNFLSPAFVSAEEPLHEPVDPSTLAKEGSNIGMWLSFTKSALPDTTRNIIFLPAAWRPTCRSCSVRCPGER